MQRNGLPCGAEGDLPHVTLPDTIASGITTVLSSPSAAAAVDEAARGDSPDPASDPDPPSVASTMDLSGRGGSVPVSDAADPLDVESMLVDEEDEDGPGDAFDEEGADVDEEEDDGDSLVLSASVAVDVSFSEAGELGSDVFDAVGEGAAASDSSGVSASAGAMACIEDAGDAFTSGVEDGGKGGGGALLALEGASCGGVEDGGGAADGTLEEAGSPC